MPSGTWSGHSFRRASGAVANAGHVLREVVNGLMYVLSGCQWRAVPKDSTLHDYWTYGDGTLEFILVCLP